MPSTKDLPTQKATKAIGAGNTVAIKTVGCNKPPRSKTCLGLGRWNWKSQSSLPTLPHHSLPLLKMLSPFVEPSKTGV